VEFSSSIRKGYDVRKLVLGAVGAAILGVVGSSVTAPAQASVLPKVIQLPDGFRPEGIATSGSTFYVGSLADGAIYRGSLLTGRGAVFIPGTDGGSVNGLEVAGGTLYAAGGSTGTLKAYDLRTGRLLVSRTVGGFINDVSVLRGAAYYTDSNGPNLYELRRGQVRTIPTTIPIGEGFNANGIETSPDGRSLLVIQSNTGTLWSVSPRTGTARAVTTGLTNGDGILRRGPILYVVRNQDNEIAAVDLRTTRVVRTITDPAFDVPTTVAAFGPFLYAVNARFSTTPTPTTPYSVVRVP
jgi:sugar lactone lactonase YvrE